MTKKIINYKITFEELAERQQVILSKQGPITYEMMKEQVERVRKNSKSTNKKTK